MNEMSRSGLKPPISYEEAINRALDNRNMKNNWKDIKKARRGPVKPFHVWALGFLVGVLFAGMVWYVTKLFVEAF
jgi:hypothetical protein